MYKRKASTKKKDNFLNKGVKVFHILPSSEWFWLLEWEVVRKIEAEEEQYECKMFRRTIWYDKTPFIRIFKRSEINLGK